MSKEITEIKEEFGIAIQTFKNGQEQKLKIKTTKTFYNDGTNDCHIDVLEPLDSSSVPLQPKGMKEGDK